jgi:hypothetical protein
MLRSILTTAATAAAASRVKTMAKQTAYGAVALGAFMLAIVFTALAIFFWLSEAYGPAPAAAGVAAILAVLTACMLAWIKIRQNAERNENLADRLGLPGMLGMKDTEQIEKFVEQGVARLRHVDPVKLTVGTLVVGFLISRLNR